MTMAKLHNAYNRLRGANALPSTKSLARVPRFFSECERQLDVVT